MGVSLTQFFVENISLPPEVEEALDKRSKMAVLGNLDQYTKLQTAEAIPTAAANPRRLRGFGAGIGAALRSASRWVEHLPGLLAPGGDYSGPHAVARCRRSAAASDCGCIPCCNRRRRGRALRHERAGRARPYRQVHAKYARVEERYGELGRRGDCA